MTCLGTRMRSVEELEALNPGAVLTDPDGDKLVRTPEGWWYTPNGKATWESAVLLEVCSPLTLTEHSPMDAMLADPKGRQLVQDIHDRKLGLVTRHSQMEQLPVGTECLDVDGDRVRKDADGCWRYPELNVHHLAAATILRTYGPLQVVAP